MKGLVENNREEDRERLKNRSFFLCGSSLSLHWYGFYSNRYLILHCAGAKHFVTSLFSGLYDARSRLESTRWSIQRESRKKQDEAKEAVREWERAMEPVRLLANSLLVNPSVYKVECSILPDDGSDKTYGFISKQLLDQTEPGQGHSAVQAMLSLHKPEGLLPSKAKLTFNNSQS